MQTSEQRPIRLRARRDLVLQESVYQGEESWIVKDPVGMKYFRIREPERIALEMLDETHSYQDIRNELERQFPEQKIRVEDVHMLCNQFHKNGLLISNSTGQAAPLQVKRNKELKQKATQLLMSVMSLRFPGVDPERFLNWLYPKVSWFFSKSCFYICVLICIAALALVLQNMDEFYRRLPEFGQFFDLKNVFFMATIMIVTKTIHEFGHGLMCKHFGGECHEIGFMLLVLTPAMYCNTSDSWLLPNKWHRIAIGAAGMYVEIVMAAICTFIWWYTQPGVIHYMALNIIFLCSVSTLLFNANPLLRYDGYYMLSDYLEIPNLAQKSKTALVSKLRVTCLGMKPVNARSLPQRNQVAFALYSVASFVYRWFVMLMIFWFLVKIFEPYGLSILGHIMIVFSLVGMIVMPLYKMVKFFWYPGRFREVKKVRFAISSLVVALLAWGLFMLPVPHQVSASFVVMPIDSKQIYVSQPGELKEIFFEPGDRVKKGDVVAVLENEDLELELERLRGLLAHANSQLVDFRLRQDQLEDSSRLILRAESQVEDLEKRVELQQRTVAELTLVATRDGVIIPPPNRPAEPVDVLNEQRTLVSWSGTPLDPENRQAFLPYQTLYCIIGEPSQMKAMLVVEQSSAKFVEPNQPVTLMLDEHIGHKLRGSVEFVSRDPLTVVPRELSINNGGSIATKPVSGGRSAGQEAPMFPSYEATVPLDKIDMDLTLINGFRGQAKVHVGTAPLGQRFIRYLKTVINFR
ncbi:MAG: biotin/lipoyl-binding protein [Mariniblastus sp.]